VTRPKLLLADASVTTRKIVELSFAADEIDVLTTTDAESAMQKFTESLPDIVLVDVGLSGMSGYQICGIIKDDEATRHIPVLLLVGSFEPFDNYEAERVGADGFLTTPFNSSRDLVTCVTTLLARNFVTEPAEVEIPAEPEVADVEDIDSLYNRSITETVEVDDIDSLSQIESFQEYSSLEEVDSLAEIESLPDVGSVETIESLEDVDSLNNLLGDSGMDDEMIEASRPADTASKKIAEFVPQVAKSSVVAELEPAPELLIEEPVTAKSIEVDSGPAPITDVLDLKLKRVLDEPETVEPISVEKEPVLDAVVGPEEPSPDLIALIAQRVVERLSDKVIREVAQTAVPAIAEKLIREALEDGKKD